MSHNDRDQHTRFWSLQVFFPSLMSVENAVSNGSPQLRITRKSSFAWKQTLGMLWMMKWWRRTVA